MELMFKDVDVHINKTQILHKVTGLVKQGEMLAVMGPSGAGKSTLLNALAGRITPTDGQVTLNKEPMTKQHKRKVAYVLQQDVFFPNLTLKETLTFSAMLRLPDKMPHELKMQRVQEIIDILELNKCKDTVVGNASIPGLSGGEKKRATIGMELLTNPLVLLLDEPTSGLDYAIALNLMKTMKRYTEQTNKTVVVTIHQPSSQIFHLFNHLLLLGDGQVTYFGDTLKIVDVFSDLGYPCSQHYNPADFIMEKLKETPGLTEIMIKKCQEDRSTKWPIQLRKPYVKPEKENGGILANMVRRVSLVPTGDDSKKKRGSTGSTDSGVSNKSTTEVIEEESVEVVVEKRGSIVETDLHMDLFLDKDSKWPTGFWTQYKTLTRRTMKQSRHRILSKLSIVQSVIVTFYASLLWFQTPQTEESLRDRMGMIFFSIVYWGFVTLIQALNAFPEERPVINRERAAGSYRLSAYYLAKMTSELPLACTLPVIYCLIVYWCVGLQIDPKAYFQHTFTVLYFALAMQGFGILLGVAITDPSRCLTTGLVFLLLSMLAGGYYQRHLQSWAIWLKYLSIVNYPYHALLHTEFSGVDAIECLPASQSYFTSCSEGNATMVTGEQVLESLEATVPNWVNYLVLTVWFICVRYLGYILLRYIKKPPGLNK